MLASPPAAPQGIQTLRRNEEEEVEEEVTTDSYLPIA